MASDPNPYTAPVQGGESSTGVNFALTFEQRRLVAGTAVLMIVAGALQLFAAVVNLIVAGLDLRSGIIAAITVAVPALTLVAGVSLRKLQSASDDRDALMAGLRSLTVATAIKGIALMILVALGILMVLAVVFGIGRSLFAF